MLLKEKNFSSLIMFFKILHIFYYVDQFKTSFNITEYSFINIRGVTLYMYMFSFCIIKNRFGGKCEKVY